MIAPKSMVGAFALASVRAVIVAVVTCCGYCFGWFWLVFFARLLSLRYSMRWKTAANIETVVIVANESSTMSSIFAYCSLLPLH